MHGWQVWPIVGQQHKVLTMQTNGFGDIVIDGGHDRSFILWPLWMAADNNLNTENPERYRTSIPLFAITRSPQRDATTVIWPLFSWIDDRGKKYREWEMPWPMIIFARGEGKTTDRVWPIFSQSHNDTLESDSYLWPVYQYKRMHSGPLDRHSTRICFYLYVGIRENNLETGKQKRRFDMWPFFTSRTDFNGNWRLQILAPVEPVLGTSRGVDRNWSPVWSIWRTEQNPEKGVTTQSFLWNLYRGETGPDRKKTSLLFGLFQYQREGEDSTTRLFYVPVSRSHKK
jgi:hypothetical protein